MGPRSRTAEAESAVPGPADLSGRTRARAEWHRLEEVLIHRPGIEMFFGLMEPYAFLYERAFSIDDAVTEHAALERALRDAGVTVRRLKRLAVDVERRRPGFLERLRSEAGRLVHYSGPRPMVARARRALRADLPAFDAETLFNILLLRPSVRLDRRAGVRGVFPTVELDGPLANLCFLRDQQALTAGGFVLGRMSKAQRRQEPLVTGSILSAAGARVAGTIAAPGTFEGGDFLPLGEFALLGTGDRTNASGVRQLLAMPHGFDEVGVVHQPSHPALPDDAPDPMINMHLDTYLNVAGEGLAVGSEVLLRAARVDVWRRRGGGRLVREPGRRFLKEFLAEHRFEVIPLSSLEQLCYATNFLCLSDRRLLAVDVREEVDRVLGGLRRAARRHPHRYQALLRLVLGERRRLREGRGLFPQIAEVRERGLSVTALPLRAITGGYGGAHCLTCVLRRREP
jgi:arginine deiminase